MRLAGQAKLGYFPAHPYAIECILKHLTTKPLNPEKPLDTLNILDPCAGEGAAIKQLQEGLGVKPEHTYAVELDGGRTQKIKEAIPGANVLGPASFHGVMMIMSSIGMAYVNPPFDSELGGGRREEQGFVEKATRIITQKGILVLVCPMRALSGNRSFCEFIDSHYEDVRVYRFPDNADEEGNVYRKYNEIVVFGKKRKDAVPKDMLHQVGTLHKMEFHWGNQYIHGLAELGSKQPKDWMNGRAGYDRDEEIRTWEIPLAWKPHTFKKTMFTDDELLEVIEKSPLNRLLAEVPVLKPSRPPLPLDKGHLGLILASGMLNGVVEGPHGNHVVRGSSKKIEYHNVEQSTSDENPETGAVTTKDVFSEKMVTVIRVVEQNGNIKTFSNQPVEKAEEETQE